MTTEPIYRAGMIGVGRKGHGHARGYQGNPRTEVVAAADPDASNLEIFLERFPVKGYADYHEMLAEEEFDIAAPILPVGPNAKVVIDCARAPGIKAIYCEKPMAVSLEEADQMVEECASRGIHLASGDAFRNMPQHWKVKRLIDSGAIGEVRSINLYLSTNEISGGGCQGLSVLRLFAGDVDVDWVTGWCDDPASDNDQNMGGLVHFANGIEGFIHRHHVLFKGVEVLCTEGVYYSDFSSGHLWRGKKQGKLVEDETFFDEFGDRADWINPSGTRQRAGIQALVESLDQGMEPRCSGANMRKVLEIAIGLRESHRNDHAPVKFPIADRSLRIYPKPARLRNKKEVMAEEEYNKQITMSAGTPLGGAEVR